MDTESTKTGKIAVRICGKMVDKNISPIVLMKGAGKKGSDKMLRSYIRNWTSLECPKEMDAYKRLVQQTCMRKSSSEISICMICRLAPGFSAWAREPLLYNIMDLTMPVSVLIGDNDFITWDGLPEVYEQGKLYPGSTIGIVPDSGHQIQSDNPEYTSKHIVEFVFGEERLQ